MPRKSKPQVSVDQIEAELPADTPEEFSTKVALRKNTFDLHKAIMSGKLKVGNNDIRYLVDGYYAIQDTRKRFASQSGAADAAEPAELTDYFAWQFSRIEDQVKKALDAWTDTDPVSRWAKSQVGVGPVLSAGLRAHINIERCPTVGHIWVFAGLDPRVKWLGAEGAKDLVQEVMGKDKTVTSEHWAEIQKRTNRKAENIRNLVIKTCGKVTRASLIKTLARRPWNAQLKTICWKISDCFVKTSGNEASKYGKFYFLRKGKEVEANERLMFKDQAAEGARRVGKDTEAYKAYVVGKLPPAHLEARARRWTVKLFLSHWHEVAYRERYKKDPPKPYAIQELGHVHWIRAEEDFRDVDDMKKALETSSET